MLITTINSSIVLIALPDIFRGIHLDPLLPGNTSYLLWMMMGFMVATAVLVVTFGRIGDMFGRVRMFNLGLAVFTLCSILLSVTWMNGSSAALWLIAMRIGQGVGGALVMGNSSAILTDAFPSQERGLALGVNAVAAIAGSFMGLVLGGLLAPVSWRLVFLVSVPFGVFGTVWAYWKLQERGERRPARIDWWGNATFAIGLILVLVSITYGIQPYGGHSMGWTNPLVLAEMVSGLRAARALRRHRAAQRGSDVQPRALPHPGLHRRQHRHAARVARPRRADVHADHLAAGHLAAAARLQLLGDAALGGHLHAAADGRLPGRGPALGAALGSLRRAARSRPAACSPPRSRSCCSSCCP